MENEEKKGFVIRDRRHFDEEGNPREETEEVREENEPARKTVVKQEPPRKEPPTDEDKPSEKPPLQEQKLDPPPDEESYENDIPPLDFSNFVMSLATSALMHMGEIEDPVSKKKTKNLPGARQMIDIILMMEEKTRGNLNPEEKSLIESLVYDLRLKYVKAVKG